MANNLDADVNAIARIDAVPSILDVVCRTTGMGFSAIARVTEERWIACAVHDEIAFGMQPGGELDVRTTICDEVRAGGREIVIDHVDADDAWRRHPTPIKYGFQSYISMPIHLPSGEFFGTLCAIDPRPARLNRPEVIETFRLFASLIAFHLQAQDQMSSTRAALLDERKIAELREQFIAILGHDLRNPLATIESGADVLSVEPLSFRGRSTLKLIQRSAQRMGALIGDVLDLARGRLGGGMVLVRRDALMQTDLEQVVEELQAVWPERIVATDFSLPRPVLCDRARIGQLVSNLLANALTHGAPDSPVRLSASIDQDVFELSVENQGEPIPAAALAHLFEPFFRYAADPHKQGLGLGLYIASEIARAHGGTLEVASSPEQTRFCFRMPLSSGTAA